MSGTTTGQLHELKAKDIKVKSSLGCLAPPPPRFPTWEYSHSTHWLNCECIIHEHRQRDGRKESAEGQTQPANKTLCGSSKVSVSIPLSISFPAPVPLSFPLSLFLSSALSWTIALPWHWLRQCVERIDNCLVARCVKRGTNEKSRIRHVIQRSSLAASIVCASCCGWVMYCKIL